MRLNFLILILMMGLLSSCAERSVLGRWKVPMYGNVGETYSIYELKWKDDFGAMKTQIEVSNDRYRDLSDKSSLIESASQKAVFIEQNRLRVLSYCLIIYDPLTDTIRVKKDENMDRDFVGKRK